MFFSFICRSPSYLTPASVTPAVVISPAIPTTTVIIIVIVIPQAQPPSTKCPIVVVIVVLVMMTVVPTSLLVVRIVAACVAGRGGVPGVHLTASIVTPSGGIGVTGRIRVARRVIVPGPLTRWLVRGLISRTVTVCVIRRVFVSHSPIS